MLIVCVGGSLGTYALGNRLNLKDCVALGPGILTGPSVQVSSMHLLSWHFLKFCEVAL